MAVGFESEEIHLYRLRERLRAMSDEALITFGKYARQLFGIRVSGTPDPYKIQLEEARQDWRRRHPKNGQATRWRQDEPGGNRVHGAARITRLMFGHDPEAISAVPEIL
jgi:hypothetical protein